MPARRSPEHPRTHPAWTSAPRAALSSPLTLVAATITTLLSCFLAMGAVLHSSSAAGATLDYQASTVCPDAYGPAVTLPRIASEHVPTVTDSVTRHAAAHGFDRPTLSLFSGLIPGADFGTGEGYTVRLAYRDGGTDHLTRLDGSAAPGLWVGRDLAGSAGIGPGARVVNADWPTVTGVYTDLYNPAPRWWCSVQDLAVQNRLVDHIPTGSVLFATDRDTFAAATQHQPSLERLTVTFPTPAPRTLAEAEDNRHRAEAFLADVRADLRDHGLDGALTSVPFTRSLDLAHQARSTVTWSILPLAALSVGIGLAGTATVALQWYHRRHSHLRLLSSRGHGPLPLGGLAAAELGVPIALGGAAGALLAYLARGLYTPPGEAGGAAVLTGAAVALGVLGCSLLLLVTVVAVRAHREFDIGVFAARRRRRFPLLVPWELVTAAVAFLGWHRLPDYGDTTSTGPVPTTDPIALLYPVAVVLTTGLFAARLVWWALNRAHRLDWWSVPTLHWAVRRLAHARTPVTGVLIVSVLAVGTLAVGTSISSGQQHALATKSGVFVGAESRTDVENSVGRYDTPLPEALDTDSTVIGTLDTGGAAGTLFVVDPDTVTRAAYTDHLPDDEFSHALTALTTATDDDTLPAIAIGSTPPTHDTPLGTVRSVGAIDVAPVLGGSAGYLVSRTALDADRLDRVSRWAVLSAQRAEQVGAALRNAGIVHMNAVDRATALNALPFYVVEWTFAYVSLLGAALGAAATLALLIAVEVRRRQNTLTGALALRMGLHPRALWGTHATELGTLAVSAVTIGATCGITVAALSAHRFDPARWLSPATELPPPLPFITTVGACAATVVALACWIAVRSVRTARVGELLRD